MAETTKLDRLPEGCECRLDFYLVSDAADVEIRVGLGGMTLIPEFEDVDPEPLKLIASLGTATEPLTGVATDWRFMRRAEIADYKRRNPDG